jgi:hypothetical protein
VVAIFALDDDVDLALFPLQSFSLRECLRIDTFTAGAPAK